MDIQPNPLASAPPSNSGSESNIEYPLDIPSNENPQNPPQNKTKSPQHLIDSDTAPEYIPVSGHPEDFTSTTTQSHSPLQSHQQTPLEVPAKEIPHNSTRAKSKSHFDANSFLPFLRQPLSYVIQARTPATPEYQEINSKSSGKVLYTLSHPNSQIKWIPIFSSPSLNNQFQVNIIICRTQYSFQISFSTNPSDPPNIIPLGPTSNLVNSVNISEFMSCLPCLFSWKIVPNILFVLFFQLKSALRTIFTNILQSSNNQKIQFELSTVSELPQIEYIIKDSLVIFELQLADVKIVSVRDSLDYNMALLQMVDDPSITLPETKRLSPPNLSISLPLFPYPSSKSDPESQSSPTLNSTNDSSISNSNTPGANLQHPSPTERIPKPLIVFTNAESSSMFTNPHTGESILYLPPWSDQSCILDHYYTVTEAINHQASTLVDKMWNKALLLLAFQKKFFQTLAFDSVNFSSIVLLREESNSSTIFEVVIPFQWPNKPPKISLTSPYDFGNDGKPISFSLGQFPYSPRWPVQEMADRIYDSIIGLLPKFHAQCQHLALQAAQKAESVPHSAHNTTHGVNDHYHGHNHGAHNSNIYGAPPGYPFGT